MKCLFLYCFDTLFFKTFFLCNWIVIPMIISCISSKSAHCRRPIVQIYSFNVKSNKCRAFSFLSEWLQYFVGFFLGSEDTKANQLPVNFAVRFFNFLMLQVSECERIFDSRKVLFFVFASISWFGEKCLPLCEADVVLVLNDGGLNLLDQARGGAGEIKGQCVFTCNSLYLHLSFTF